MKNLALGAFAVAVSAMSTASLAQALPTTKVCVGNATTPITVEIAATNEARAKGLMQRAFLPQHEGMWFQYPSERPGYNGFWMFRTLIPLDIAFIDSDNQIVRILQMQPCESMNPRECPSYRPGVNYFSALEVPLDYFAEQGIKVGDKIRETNADCNKESS